MLLLYHINLKYQDEGIAWILLAYSDQLVAVLYASTDSAGTYITSDEEVATNTSWPKLGGVVASTVTFVSELQLANAKPPILVTPSGIVILVKEVQSENALYTIVVKLVGSVTLDKLVQL